MLKLKITKNYKFYSFDYRAVTSIYGIAVHLLTKIKWQSHPGMKIGINMEELQLIRPLDSRLYDIVLWTVVFSNNNRADVRYLILGPSVHRSQTVTYSRRQHMCSLSFDTRLASASQRDLLGLGCSHQGFDRGQDEHGNRPRIKAVSPVG